MRSGKNGRRTAAGLVGFAMALALLAGAPTVAAEESGSDPEEPCAVVWESFTIDDFNPVQLVTLDLEQSQRLVVAVDVPRGAGAERTLVGYDCYNVTSLIIDCYQLYSVLPVEFLECLP